MDIISALEELTPISLQDLDAVKLLNRVDTKYVFNRRQLPQVLLDISPNYNVLTIEGNRINHYKSVYYDTDELLFYHKHLRGKLNRYKVRMRQYVDSGLCYLEIKFKNNKKRTIKSRKKKPVLEESLSEESKQYIARKAAIKSEEISPKLWNHFSRITLAHKRIKERLTIDLDLTFYNAQRHSEVHQLVIAELKQEKFSMLSDFVKVMRKHHIRPMRISKYCLGIALTYQHVRNNRFKPRMLNILKVTNGTAFKYPVAQ